MSAASPIRIALDAMGGDRAPGAVLDGARDALARFSDLSLRLVGPQATLEPLLARSGLPPERIAITHAPDIVADAERPAQALRSGRHSSMRVALDLVRRGEADAAVSAGNTGALMAMARLVLRTLPLVDRPALCSILPNQQGASAILDLGANAEGPPESLLQFAVMGALYAQAVLGIDNPRIGLINVGAEELKGQERIRLAGQMIQEAEARDRLPGRYLGFVEGNMIGDGGADVFVTDGFTGNVALKTLEGTANLYSHFLRQAFSRSLRAKLGYLLLRPSLRRLRAQVDPRVYNGAMLIGVAGIAIKSHGSADGFGWYNALRIARDLASRGILERISQGLARLASLAPGAASGHSAEEPPAAL